MRRATVYSLELKFTLDEVTEGPVKDQVNEILSWVNRRIEDEFPNTNGAGERVPTLVGNSCPISVQTTDG